MEFSMNTGNHALNNKHKDLLPFLMDHIPAAFREKAENELNETEERRLESIKEIRERIKGVKTLNDVEFHNDFLQLFLRHSKYDVKRALRRLEKFTTMRRNHNPFLTSLSDQMFETLKSADIVQYLPWRTPDGCVIMHIKHGNWDFNKIPLMDVNRYCVFMYLQCLRDPMTQINGFVVIHDWKNQSLRSVGHFTPKYLYEAAKAFLDNIPMRFQGIHVINHPGAVKIIWAILKPLLSEKLKRRVAFHSSEKDILKSIPPPVGMGGYLNEEFNESKMSDWEVKAFEQQKQCPLGGQCNYY